MLADLDCLRRSDWCGPDLPVFWSFFCRLGQARSLGDTREQMQTCQTSGSLGSEPARITSMSMFLVTAGYKTSPYSRGREVNDLCSEKNYKVICMTKAVGPGKGEALGSLM